MSGGARGGNKLATMKSFATIMTEFMKSKTFEYRAGLQRPGFEESKMLQDWIMGILFCLYLAVIYLIPIRRNY